MRNKVTEPIVVYLLSPYLVLGHIYGMKNQFWAGLGSWAVLVKKKFGADYEQLLRSGFLCFHGQKISLKFFENTVAFALKICLE